MRDSIIASQDTRPETWRPQRQRHLTFDRHAPWIDVALVMLMVDASLFNLVLGPLTPAIILVSIAAFAVLRWERLPVIARDCWPLLLIPLFALASSMWSEIPGTTAYYATLYAATVIAGMMIGRGMVRGAFLRGYFLAFAFFTVVSILSFRWAVWGGAGGEAFVGLTQSKNSAGDMAGVGLIATICFLFWAMSQRRLLLVLSALLTIPLYLFVLWFSRATGALIATALVFACVLAWIASRSLPRQARAVIFALAAILVLVLIATQSWWLPPLFEAVLENSGKDTGLTGRTDLWRFADDLIARRPWLGLGYNAFWVHGNLDAEYLWRMMQISTRMGFNFHNTFREILVHLGIVGLALYAVVAFVGAGRLIALTALRPSHEQIFASAILTFYAVKMPFEVVGVSTIHFATITFVAVLASGYRREAASEKT
jgi:exopolysaccharide production protein ExoQ